VNFRLYAEKTNSKTVNIETIDYDKQITIS